MLLIQRLRFIEYVDRPTLRHKRIDKVIVSSRIVNDVSDSHTSVFKEVLLAYVIGCR